MRAARTCLKCGRPLLHDAAEGFCPACMLEGALKLGLAELPQPEDLADENPAPAHLRSDELHLIGRSDASVPHSPAPTRREPAQLGAPRHAVFGDYELLEEIARGGMGVVYRARQISLDRTVAVKLILFGPYADEASVRRFRAEAAAAARLQHPNIVAIHEIGEQDGQPFFSMDYVAGRDLENYAREHPFTAREAARLLQTLAEAVHYAHEQGIVHRDLKPSNILIDSAVEPHITDFGLAKHLDNSQLSTLNPHLTLTGQVLGSPSFLPPEQASGKHGEIGPRTDVYALGAILYFLLTGRPPFAAETISDTLHDVLHGQPVAPRALNRSIPRDLETICLKCLEKEPAKRHASAQYLADELNRFLEGKPIHARAVGTAGRLWRWCRRKPVIAGLTAAVVLSVGLGFVGVLWEWRQSERHRVQAEANAKESRRNSYAADMLVAQQALKEENIGHAEAILRKYVPRQGEEDLRGWEWHYAWAQCQTDELFSLAGNGELTWPLALSPDASLLASGTDSRVTIWDFEKRIPKRYLDVPRLATALAFGKSSWELIVGTAWDGAFLWRENKWQVIRGVAGDPEVRSLAVSPDGKLLAIYGRRFLQLVNLSDLSDFRPPLMLRPSSFNMPGGLAFSPDSASLAYCQGDGTIVITNLSAPNQVRELKGHTGFVSSLAFSPDGRSLASGSRDCTVRLWDVPSGTSLQVITNFAGFVSCLAISPDGLHLAVAGYGQTVKIIETRSGEVIRSYKGHRMPIQSLLFLPDGRPLTCSLDGTIRCWPVGKRQYRASCPLPSDTRRATLTPGGKFLYLRHDDQTYSVWRTDPPAEVFRRSYPLSSPFTASDISPDGNLWLAAPAGGGVKLFDNANTHLIDELSAPGAAINGFAFSPDGQTFAALQNDLTCRVWRCIPELQRKTTEGRFRQVAILNFDVESSGDLVSLGFGGSDRFLCAGYGGATEIWDILSASKLAELRGDLWDVASGAFSRDLSTLATASAGGNIELWDLGTHRQTAVLGGQLATSWSVVFSPDETRLAACGGDGMVRIWEVATRNLVAALKLHSERLVALAFRDNETLIALAPSRLFVLRGPKLPARETTVERESVGGPVTRAVVSDLRAPNRVAIENLSLLGLSPRPLDAPENLLDLSRFYNASLEGIQPWQLLTGGTGRQLFGAIEFDVRGAIRLTCTNKAFISYQRRYPERVNAIPVGRKCRRLHFLHFAFGSENEGMRVGSYFVKSTDGKRFEVPLNYGEELRRLGSKDQVPLRSRNSEVVCIGTNTVSQPFYLSRTTWNNPRPNISVQAIDFVSSMTRSAPVLVAITAEP